MFHIPAISDDLLSERMNRLRPLTLVGGVPHTIRPVNPRTVSFIWDPQVDEAVHGMRHCATARTLHSYGAPILFKPSIAEVLAQLPADLPDSAVGFSIEGPRDANDLNRELGALNAGYHVATVTFWENAPPKETPDAP